MRAAEWRTYMESLIDRLRKPIYWSTAPHRKQELEEIAERVKTAKNARERKSIEDDLDCLFDREIDLRRPSDWRPYMESLVEGILRTHLCASAPRKAHRALDEMLIRVRTAKNARERKMVERDLDALVESAPYLRAAYRRWLRETLPPILEEVSRLVPLLIEQIKLGERKQGS